MSCCNNWRRQPAHVRPINTTLVQIASLWARLFCHQPAPWPTTPEHVLLRCPCLAGVRLRVLGNINGDPTQLQDDDAVAALARGFWHQLKPLADGRRYTAPEGDTTKTTT